MPDTPNPGVPASEWSAYFKNAGLLQEPLALAMDGKPRFTAIGKFLSRNVGQEVPIEVTGRTGKCDYARRQVEPDQSDI